MSDDPDKNSSDSTSNPNAIPADWVDWGNGYGKVNPYFKDVWDFGVGKIPLVSQYYTVKDLWVAGKAAIQAKTPEEANQAHAKEISVLLSNISGGTIPLIWDGISATDPKMKAWSNNQVEDAYAKQLGGGTTPDSKITPIIVNGQVNPVIDRDSEIPDPEPIQNPTQVGETVIFAPAKHSAPAKQSPYDLSDLIGGPGWDLAPSAGNGGHPGTAGGMSGAGSSGRPVTGDTPSGGESDAANEAGEAHAEVTERGHEASARQEQNARDTTTSGGGDKVVSINKTYVNGTLESTGTTTQKANGETVETVNNVNGTTVVVTKPAEPPKDEGGGNDDDDKSKGGHGGASSPDEQGREVNSGPPQATLHDIELAKHYHGPVVDTEHDTVEPHSMTGFDVAAVQKAAVHSPPPPPTDGDGDATGRPGHTISIDPHAFRYIETPPDYVAPNWTPNSHAVTTGATAADHAAGSSAAESQDAHAAAHSTAAGNLTATQVPGNEPNLHLSLQKSPGAGVDTAKASSAEPTDHVAASAVRVQAFVPKASETKAAKSDPATHASAPSVHETTVGKTPDQHAIDAHYPAGLGHTDVGSHPLHDAHAGLAHDVAAAAHTAVHQDHGSG
jgi:hypothetical protein